MGETGFSFLPSPIFHWPYRKLKSWEGLEQWFSIWAAPRNQPGNFQEYRSLGPTSPESLAWLLGMQPALGGCYCALRVENHRLESSFQPMVLSLGCRLASHGKLLPKTLLPHQLKPHFGGEGSRIFRKIPDDFWCTARVKVNWHNLTIAYHR